jgi:hypothetical protein
MNVDLQRTFLIKKIRLENCTVPGSQGDCEIKPSTFEIGGHELMKFHHGNQFKKICKMESKTKEKNVETNETRNDQKKNGRNGMTKKDKWERGKS